MSEHGAAAAAAIKSQLTHPVIDADGHWLEYGPLLAEELGRRGGPAAADGYERLIRRVSRSLDSSSEERLRRGQAQESFWGFPARNTRDRATALMPRLLYERSTSSASTSACSIR